MTHQQILDKLAAKSLVQNIDEDMARLTINTMIYAKNNNQNTEDLVDYYGGFDDLTIIDQSLTWSLLCHHEDVFFLEQIKNHNHSIREIPTPTVV